MKCIYNFYTILIVVLTQVSLKHALSECALGLVVLILVLATGSVLAIMMIKEFSIDYGR